MSDNIKPIGTMVYPIPIRPGYLAQLVVPMDLSKQEAERLSEFLRALVVPWAKEGGR